MRRKGHLVLLVGGMAVLLLTLAASDPAPAASEPTSAATERAASEAMTKSATSAMTTAPAGSAQVESEMFGSGAFRFAPLSPVVGDAACLNRGAIRAMNTDEVFQLPAGFTQRVIGRQSEIVTSNPEVSFDMLTFNETGPERGRYLYRSHEVHWFAALSVIDMKTGVAKVLAERVDWEAFDGLVWTPHRTILVAEERIVQNYRDPDYPMIERGLVYEYFPKTGEVVARPAIGARSHEGMRFDRQGNLYGISESRGIKNAGQSGHSGAIFKFVPDRRGDLSSGQLYALRVLSGRTGPAVWERLAMDPVTFDSDTAAQAAGATGWDRPEDLTIATVTIDNVGDPRSDNNAATLAGRGPRQRRQVMYVAMTEDSTTEPAHNNGLVIKIELNGDQAYVSNYVLPGVNVTRETKAPFDPDSGYGFDNPDNLAIGPNGDLYIAEDDSPGDIWVARGKGDMADRVELFARLRDCIAEPSGIYFDRLKRKLYVNSMHAGLNGFDDLTIEITRDTGFANGGSQ